MDRRAWWATVMGSQRIQHNWAATLFTFFFFLTQNWLYDLLLVSLLSLPSGILVCKYIITYSYILPLLSAWVVSNLWL